MASIMDTISHSMQEQISELLKPHRVCLMKTVGLNHSTQHRGRPHCRVLVLTLWRGFMVTSREPARVESSFSYLEICSINIHSIAQVVLETDRQTFSFSVSCVQDLEAMVSHMTTSLKKIFPDSSPGRLLKKIPPDLQERLWKMTSQVEEQLEGQPISCGGFSDTYAALCDFNDLPCREEIQWDVDNIYHVHQCREFNLLDFNHLDNKDLAVAVAAVSFNQWFTKISCRDIKLSAEVQQQLVFLLSRSPSLEELSLEASGIKPDFALKMAASLREHTSSSLHSLNLSANHIEDKGVIALSQELGNLPVGLKYLSLSKVSMSSKGLGSLCQVFSTSQLISSTLMHLDLSGNPGSLATEEATFLFRFLSNTNCLSHLDLSGTDCPLDTLFVSLSVGCCSKLSHLNLAKNPFSHRKVRAVTRSIQEFFSQCSELKYICLSATKLPSQALRLLLQGLATNTNLRGLELDLSSCELRSAGAQVIQEHIFETNAISSLDISDNGFESDMVTLVLSIGRCHSLRHLALGRNFAMKSRALTDVLQRIAQLIQEEECPLESLSVCDSKLKTGTTTLINLLGSNATLAKVDISGNAIGDTGAKMLAKALLTNTKLRTLVWDRNHVTARGYQDVADALERNFTLQQMSLPLSDATQSYRNNPERTEEALQKIQRCLHRNSQRLMGEEFQQGLGAQHAEKLVQGLCLRLENSLQPLTPSNLQEVQADLLSAEEVLHNTRKFLRLLPSLYELGRKPSGGDVLHCILTDTSTTLSNEITGDIQELAQALLTCIEGVCPRVVQRANVCERLAECVSKKIRQLNTFLTETLVEQTGHILSNKLCEIRQSLSVSLSESIIEQILQDLAVEQGKLDEHIRDDLSSAPKNNIPHLRLVDHDFPTDEYVPVIWRHTFHSKSMRPAPSVKSLLDVDWEQQSSERGERESTAAHLQQHHHHHHQTHREQPHARGGGGGGGEVSGGEEEGGGRERGRCASADGRGLACASTVTLLSAAASGGQLRSESPSPSPSPPPPPPPSSSSSSSASPRPSPCSQRRRGRGDEREVEAAEDAAEAVAAAVAGARGASVIPPLPPPPPDRPLPREEEAAGRGSSPAREAPVPLGGPGSPAGSMELLPTQGQTLRHYTASRPRPRRTRTQPPSTRPQEPVSETENEAMGRVDEGVEEFFTKKILPDYTLKGQWEESIPAQGTPPESSSNPSVPIPVSSSSSDNITTSIITSPTAPPSSTSSTPTAVVTSPSSSVSPLTSSSPPPTTTTTTTAPPSKNIKKKFGDFFAFKRARAGRAAKAGGGEAGGGEGVKVKRTSIADLIRPLREAKEREREREREKEREKERGSRLVEDVNLSNDAAVTEGTVATDGCLQGDKRDKMAPATTATTTTPPSEATPPSPTTATLGLTTATSNLEEKGVTSLPVHPGHTPVSAASPPATAPSMEQEKSWTLEKERKKGGGTPDGERRLKVTRRSLREGKSQSLILLTGLEPEEKDSSHSKKYASESTSSFEQRLQVMLHRIGVAKTSPADTKTNQNKDEELRKANSEGAILDKPEPPPTFLKPRTMSSSSDTRRPMRAVEPLRSDPPLYPKPVVPERPVGPLPPKPVIAAKPCLPTPAAPGGGVGGPPALQTTAPPPQHAFHASQHLSSSAPRTTSPGLVQPWLPTLDRRPGEMEDSKTQTLNGSHEEHVAQVAVQKDSPGPTSAPSPRRDTPPAPSPRRGPSAQGRSERAQSVTDESLPKPRPRMKPLPQRRAVSVHEDALTMTQELKAVLERSPLRHRGNRGDLPTCTEDTPTGEDTVEMGDRAGEAQRKSSKKEEEEERENREKNKMEKRRTGHGVTAVYEAAPAAVETPSLEATEPDPASAIPPPALSLRPASALGSEKVQSPQERSPAPSTTATLSHTVDKSHMSPSQEKTPSTTPGTADVGESTQEERGETVSKQHTEKAEPPDQRTETLLFK